MKGLLWGSWEVVKKFVDWGWSLRLRAGRIEGEKSYRNLRLFLRFLDLVISAVS